MDSDCEDGSEYIGNGFNKCWGMSIPEDLIGASETQVLAWWWLKDEQDRLSPEVPVEICLFETTENTLFTEFIIMGASAWTCSVLALGAALASILV